ncbi:MAG: serine hydrolase [Candidatus Kerfeldbacteria bacterium]|nr:serine hydrolase [Candidatus Kerfeldbacteria bacterium]
MSKKVTVYRILAAVFLLGFLVCGYLIFFSNNCQSACAVPYSKYLDPSVGRASKKDLIVNAQYARNYLTSVAKEHEDKFDMSIYFEYFPTGMNVAINPELKLWPASLTKLPVAMVTMKKIEDGTWHHDDELVLLDQDIDPKSGDLYSSNSVGTRFTIDQLLQKLLVDSDNTAYRILYRNIEARDFTDLINEVGLDELFDKEGKITAKEYSRLLRSLYFATFLNGENSEKIIKLLTQSTFNKYLSAGLPVGVEFAHKYGENVDYNLFSDSGIVYVPHRPYILSVMMQAKKGTADEDGVEAEKIMKQISEKIYDYVSKY